MRRKNIHIFLKFQGNFGDAWILILNENLDSTAEQLLTCGKLINFSVPQFPHR